MGLFVIPIDVAKPGKRARWQRIDGVMIDTGSYMTWLPEDVLRSLGIDVFRKDYPLVMVNGQQIKRDVGIAIIRHDGFKTVDEVVFAKAGDYLLLGAHTLEGFNALVDPVEKKLVTRGAIPTPTNLPKH